MAEVARRWGILRDAKPKIHPMQVQRSARDMLGLAAKKQNRYSISIDVDNQFLQHMYNMMVIE